MTTDKPLSPADPRPDGEPYYIDGTCPDCGTDLEHLQDAVETGWHDEFHCPRCDAGIHMDWPHSELAALIERAETGEYVELGEL